MQTKRFINQTYVNKPTPFEAQFIQIFQILKSIKNMNDQEQLLLQCEKILHKLFEIITMQQLTINQNTSKLAWKYCILNNLIFCSVVRNDSQQIRQLLEQSEQILIKMQKEIMNSKLTFFEKQQKMLILLKLKLKFRIQYSITIIKEQNNDPKVMELLENQFGIFKEVMKRYLRAQLGGKQYWKIIQLQKLIQKGQNIFQKDYQQKAINQLNLCANIQENKHILFKKFSASTSKKPFCLIFTQKSCEKKINPSTQRWISNFNIQTLLKPQPLHPNGIFYTNQQNKQNKGTKFESQIEKEIQYITMLLSITHFLLSVVLRFNQLLYQYNEKVSMSNTYSLSIYSKSHISTSSLIEQSYNNKSQIHLQFAIEILYKIYGEYMTQCPYLDQLIKTYVERYIRKISVDIQSIVENQQQQQQDELFNYKKVSIYQASPKSLYTQNSNRFKQKYGRQKTKRKKRKQFESQRSQKQINQFKRQFSKIKSNSYSQLIYPLQIKSKISQPKKNKKIQHNNKLKLKSLEKYQLKKNIK